jgi:hypothetical protein
MIKTFCDYVFTLAIELYKTCFFMTIRFFYQKYDYIIKLSTIIMNFSMCVITISHYNHLDYEFKILSMYVMNMYIIKY